VELNFREILRKVSMPRASLIFAGLLTLTACATRTPTPDPVTPAPGADVVWVTGSTNFNTFRCQATDVAVSTQAALEEVTRTRTDGLPAVQSGALAIPVKSLDCGNPKMNRDLRNTLAADINPVITFRLGEYVILNGTEPRKVKMDGALRIGNREQIVSVTGFVRRDANGILRLRGERAINVRTFDISPPRRFGGIMRVRDVVTVHFDVAVRPLIDPLGILSSTLQ
jgi:polyisoprenoid-binding protein YceI